MDNFSFPENNTFYTLKLSNEPIEVMANKLENNSINPVVNSKINSRTLSHENYERNEIGLPVPIKRS